MTLQSIDISGFNSGVQKNKKPFLLTQDAFSQLDNAYVWREELRKREGLKLIGRYRRVVVNQDFGAGSGVSPWVFNIYSQIVPAITGEPNAYIVPGSVHIVQGANPNNNWTDDGIGNLIPSTGGNTGYINYLTGDVSVITNDPAATAIISFNYYPGLPAMGISVREIAGINDEQTIFFDTKYSYIHDGADFQEFLSADAVTWNGTDSDFFWSTNYRGSEALDRLFFTTNFVANAGSPMRYTEGSTWTEFKPVLGGSPITNILTQTLAFGSVAYAGNLSTSQIVEGSVVITVGDNAGDEEELIFRDTPKNGTLVSSGLNVGTINYATGAITLTFNPALPGAGNWTVTAVYLESGTFMFSARILIPYYGRLLAFNTWEGTTIGTAQNIFNRCRFSQIGNPIQQDAWRSDVFGKGGFIDAPVNEDIICATYYKNTLIVDFERSTWRLQYLGEYGMPFIWERISSDFGSESTFSAVLFDSGVLKVGDKAITGSSAGDVQRIDLDIPDTVYSFRNAENGVKRVQGIRDFKKELVYWCFPDFTTLQSNQFYPNRTLVYNYRNNTFAFFRNTVTCFGNFQYPADITWDRLDIFWNDYNVYWNSEGQSKLPVIASGNQHGFAHFYGSSDVETSSDSTIDANDQESLYVTAVTVTDVVVLTIPNHNLLKEECIYLTGLNYIIEGTPPTGSSTQGSTTLNDQIYFVGSVDENNIQLSKWSQTTKQLYTDFSVTNVGTYMGGGVVALFPRLNILTKDFNPVKEIGQNIKTSYVDFLFDASVPSPINVQMRMNTVSGFNGNYNADNVGNILVGNQNVETANSKTGYIYNITQTASPICVITSPNHGLLTGDQILPDEIIGSTELNGQTYVITFLTTDTFSVSQASISAYISGGYWVQNKQQYFTLNADYAWHRFYATCFGQYLSLILSYDNEQMSQISTHRQQFVLNAMKIWYRPGGRNIFGK